MRFITITTGDYIIHAKRLIKSLRQQHPDCAITVYSEERSFESELASLGAKLMFLPEIAAMGVKRAKFSAYALAAQEGGFVYLDADILVIQPLTALLNVEEFTACRDDLRECPFISDLAHPWENFPTLSGDKYFNSGVFAVPAGHSDFFENISREAADDREWSRLTIPGKLYDNHFLCAKITQYNVPIHFISEYEYNWQGYRSYNELNCYLDNAGELRSRTTKKLLRLVHFAGIKDIDTHTASLPNDIANVLANSMGESDVGALELISTALNTKNGIEPRLKMILAQAMCKPVTEPYINPGAEASIVGLHTSVSSIVHSVKEADFLWNGLKCGSAYLSAAEYQRLRTFVADENVTAVLEFGAGYTSALFAGLGCKQVALEGWDGPWLAFARAQGADSRLIPFTPGIGFDEEGFTAALEHAFSSRGTKMIFIDSPPGTANRLCLVEQVIRLASDADFYVVHDSIRDAEAVYKLSSALGLTVIDHFPSLRGLTFLGKPDAGLIERNTPRREIKERVARMRFDVSFSEMSYAPDGELQKVFVQLANIGEETITAALDDMMFSMHLSDEHGRTIHWDTPRYRLPVDLYPTDRVSFWVELGDFSVHRAGLLFDFVKEGEFWWSSIAGTPCPKVIIS